MAKKDLVVTIIQTSLYWEDVDANLAMFTDLIDGVSTRSDLIVLPEMFTTGFSMSPSSLAETMEGKTLNWLKKTANQQNSVVTGSLIIVENGQYYNRLIWMYPDGQFESYDKKHLFTLANEDKYYTAGKERLIIDYKGWRICPLICYDLRFPVWSRNVENYDLLLYVANWPEKRSLHWKSLVRARAIENQAFAVAVNRVGVDGTGLTYSGDSMIVTPLGEIHTHIVNDERIVTASLQVERITTIREKLPFLDDRDSFKIFH